MYQMVNVATEQYYISTDQLLKFERTPVRDKSDGHVETKYKVGRDKSHLYTLNMYHSQSSCLGNGKHVQPYLDTDLPSIVNFAHLCLQSNNVSTEYSRIYRNLTKVANNSWQIFRRRWWYWNNQCAAAVRALPGTNVWWFVKTIEMLENVKVTVEKLQYALYEHMKHTERKLDTIKDNNDSLKKHLTCKNHITDDILVLEEEQGTTTSIKQKIDKNNKTFIRRLQSTTDKTNYTQEELANRSHNVDAECIVPQFCRKAVCPLLLLRLIPSFI